MGIRTTLASDTNLGSQDTITIMNQGRMADEGRTNNEGTLQGCLLVRYDMAPRIGIRLGLGLGLGWSGLGWEPGMELRSSSVFVFVLDNRTAFDYVTSSKAL